MNENITDPFTAACQVLVIDPTTLPIVDHLPEEERKPLIAHYKLLKCIQAKNKLNNNWQPDWKDSNQRKYFPWLWVKATDTGVGLSYHGNVYSFSSTFIGSRLCLGSAEDCKAIFEECKEFYEEYFLIK